MFSSVCFRMTHNTAVERKCFLTYRTTWIFIDYNYGRPDSSFSVCDLGAIIGMGKTRAQSGHDGEIKRTLSFSFLFDKDIIKSSSETFNLSNLMPFR